MKWEILVEIVANLAIRIHDLQKEMTCFCWYTLFIKGLWVGSCIVFCVRLNTIITFISAISRLKHSCFMGFSSNKDNLRLHLVTTTNKQSETAFANGTQRINLKRKTCTDFLWNHCQEIYCLGILKTSLDRNDNK